MNKMKKELIEAVKNLLKAIEENTSSKWDGHLQETVDCVVLNECEIAEDVDEPDVEYTGINNALTVLEELISERVYADLTEEEQQVVLEKHHDINVTDEWYDSTYEDAKNVGVEIKEFDLGRAQSIVLQMEYSEYESAKKVLENHGEKCGTYRTAKNFIEAWDKKVTELSDGVDKEKVAEDNEGEFDAWSDDVENDYRTDMRGHYFKMLKTNYDYNMSKEAIVETFEANEYKFDKEGSIA